LRRAEIHDRRDPVLDADDPAEAVHVVCDLVAYGELLRRQLDRGFEGAGGQKTLRCTRLCHCFQYAPARALYGCSRPQRDVAEKSLAEKQKPQVADLGLHRRADDGIEPAP
jgi:hypothetical protein